MGNENLPRNEKSSINHTLSNTSYNVKKYSEGFLLKDYIEERAIQIANYIIENNAMVRQTAKEFGISKSTVVMKWNGLGNRIEEKNIRNLLH